jgi:Domain of unknown function (DUF4234)
VTEPADPNPQLPDGPPPDPQLAPPPVAMPPAATPPYGSQPPVGYAYGPGPIGHVRSTGTCVLLTIVTLGIYPLFWYYNVHQEMNVHRNGQGLGGGLALLLAFFVGFVMPFLTASEVGDLYGARGQQKPVSGVTGCWLFLPLVGGIVWFVKTNRALNDYWISLGAPAN